MHEFSSKRTWCFRSASEADALAIALLVESAYRGDASRAGWTTEADFLDGQRTNSDSVMHLIATPGNRLLLCENDVELLASAHIERQGKIGFFGMFAVQPNLQNKGLGKAMLTEAERIVCKEWQCTEMHMTVISIRTELIAWYERRGYCRTGIYKAFPYGDEKFGVPKRDDLRFELLRKLLR